MTTPAKPKQPAHEPHSPPPESSGHAQHDNPQEVIADEATDPEDTAIESSGDREGMGRAAADKDDFHRKDK